MLIEGKKINIEVIQTKQEPAGSSIYLELEQENEKSPFPDTIGEVRIFLKGKNKDEVINRLQRDIKKAILNFK